MGMKRSGTATHTRNRTWNSGSLCLEDTQYKTPTAASGTRRIGDAIKLALADKLPMQN
jgi:hypothetical protein